MPVSCGGPQDARVAVASEEMGSLVSRRRRGFIFLGFEHRIRKSWRTGYWYLQKWLSPRVMASIRGKVRDRTDRRCARLPLEWAVENVDHVVRGWGAHFRYGGCPDRRGASAAIIGVDGQTVAVGSARRGPAGGSESAVRRELRSSAVTSEHESGIAPDVTVASAGLGARPEVGAARAQALQALRLRPPARRSGVCSW